MGTGAAIATGDAITAAKMNLKLEEVLNADVGAAAAIAWSKMAALTAAHALVGSAGGVATDVAISGDVTLANNGAVTIAANAVTIAKVEDALTYELVVVGPLLQAGVTDFTVYFNHKVTINKVRSFTTVALTTADSVITMKSNAAAAMANGVLTITQATSAVGDEDSCSPTTNKVIDVDEKLILSHNGGPDAGEAIFFIECTRTA